MLKVDHIILRLRNRQASVNINVDSLAEFEPVSTVHTSNIPVTPKPLMKALQEKHDITKPCTELTAVSIARQCCELSTKGLIAKPEL